MTHVFREGWRGPTQPNAEAVAAELDRIRQKNGSLTTTAVLDAARPPRSVLHPAFEWDDGAAAHRYRLYQARTLIRAVQIVTADEQPRAAYTFVPAQVGAGDYEQTDALVHHVDRFALALADAMRHLRSAQDRVNELRRAAGDEPDRVAVLTLASQALSAAEQAFRALH